MRIMMCSEDTALRNSRSLERRKTHTFNCRDFALELGPVTKIMGILNVTPDSFSQDGIFKDPGQAVDKALEMISCGADIIDIGGESSRPGAESISLDEESARTLPVLEKLIKQIKVPVSVDTWRSEIAQMALDKGASIINDISGLTFDEKMASIIASYNAGCVIMHIKGKPKSMQQDPIYDSLLDEITEHLANCIKSATAQGIQKESIIIDPGIGFGKTVAHNLEILKKLKYLWQLDTPILVGTSRKSFIGAALNEINADERIWGTAASIAVSICNGAHIVRVHDIKEMSQVSKLTDAIVNS